MRSLVALFVVLCLGWLAVGPAQAAREPITAQTHVIDLTKDLPTSLDLRIDDRVVFVCPSVWSNKPSITFDFAPAARGRNYSPLECETLPAASKGDKVVSASFKVVIRARASSRSPTKGTIRPDARKSSESPTTAGSVASRSMQATVSILASCAKDKGAR